MRSNNNPKELVKQWLSSEIVGWASNQKPGSRKEQHILDFASLVSVEGVSAALDAVEQSPVYAAKLAVSSREYIERAVLTSDKKTVDLASLITEKINRPSLDLTRARAFRQACAQMRYIIKGGYVHPDTDIRKIGDSSLSLDHLHHAHILYDLWAAPDADVINKLAHLLQFEPALGGPNLEFGMR